MRLIYQFSFLAFVLLPVIQLRAADKASAESEMKPYKQAIADTEVSIELVPLPGGSFRRRKSSG